MSVAVIRGTEVTRPETTPLKSSVLDHAMAAGHVETTDKGFGWRNDEGLWPSYNCLDTLIPTVACPEPLLGDTGGFKQFSMAGWQPSFTFVYYGAVQCLAVGLDKADQMSEIERVYEANEGKGIEQALLGVRFVDSDSGADVSWAGATDITPGSNVSMATALALLEGYAATQYAGVPTIHMPRAAASLLNERIVWVGDLAFTRMGSKVAIGGGYDDPDADGTSFDLYATGEVFIEKGPGISVQQHVVPGDGSGVGSDENGLQDNTVVAIVERMYRAAVDCFAAKITATVPTLP
jgi:hypothetical protein